jgi:hypothetical protein
MSKKMARLYEKAWNETVEGLNDWKKNIIINNFPYDDRCDKDVSDEVARDASRLAERWYDEMMAVPSGHNTPDPF